MEGIRSNYVNVIGAACGEFGRYTKATLSRIHAQNASVESKREKFENGFIS
jgi:hypothetical protein